MAGVSMTVAATAVVAVLFATAAMMIPALEAQTDCVSKLVPCYSFLNSTAKPSTECCSSIKEAVEKQLVCLCTIYTTPGLLAQFNVSVPQALGLSKRCDVPADLSACRAAGAGGAPSPAASLPPPGTPGSDNGAADKIACTGITSFILSLVFAMMFY